MEIEGLVDKTRTSAGEAREEVLEAEVARPSKKQKRRKEEGVGEVRVAGEAVTSDIKEEVFEEEDGLAEEVSEQVIVKADPGDFQGPEEGGSRGGEGGGLAIRSDLLSRKSQTFGDKVREEGGRQAASEGGREEAGPGSLREAGGGSLSLYGERGRCHFCSLLCPGR